MLVDLGRNDLGRVCRFGSVTVPEMLKVEHYSHVAHLVSSVTGGNRLRQSSTLQDTPSQMSVAMRA